MRRFRIRPAPLLLIAAALFAVVVPSISGSANVSLRITARSAPGAARLLSLQGPNELAFMDVEGRASDWPITMGRRGGASDGSVATEGLSVLLCAALALATWMAFRSSRTLRPLFVVRWRAIRGPPAGSWL